MYPCGVGVFLVLLLWIHLLDDVIATAQPAAAAVCTICVNGQDTVYINQTKVLTAQGLPVNTCGEMLASVGLFQQGSSICGNIRTLGPFCGCPVENHSCTLCGNRSSLLAHPLLPLPSIDLASISPGTSASVVLDCGTLESSINYLYNESDAMCLQSRLDYAKVCGCPILNETAINVNNTETKNSSSLPTAAAATSPPLSSCTVCLNGSKTPLPNRTIHLGSLPIKKCSDLDAFASLLKPDSTDCANVQSLGAYCGCHIPSPACFFCPNGEPVPFPDKITPILRDMKGLPPGMVSQSAADMTCGVYESILALPPLASMGVDPKFACLAAQFQSGTCGCSPGYKSKLVTWLFHVSAALSLIGSFFVIRDIIKNKTPERRTTYHHLMLGLTFFDVITSTGYMLSGFLLPAGYGYQAYGNHGTCVFQGFLIQLGVTSLFYSVLLSIYYLLLIKYNWKERQFRLYRNYVHVPIFVMGVALAGASTKFIAPQLGYCYVASPPVAVNFIPVTMFFGLPVGLALLIIIVCSSLMCYHVYSTEHKSAQLSTRGENFLLTKKVCWRSLCYCNVFVITLPYLMIILYGVKDTNVSPNVIFWQLAVSALFAPAQGFLNSLIYFQKSQPMQRISKLLCCGTYCCCGCCAHQSEEDDSKTQDSPTIRENQVPVDPADILNQERPRDDVIHASVPPSPGISVKQCHDDDEDDDEPFSASGNHWITD